MRMIMECITTILYFILINGEPQGLIRPSRGLCQGDSLSPFLFLFCAEGLHALLSKAANDGEIRGYSLCRAGPKVTHFFFFFLRMTACYFLGPILWSVAKFFNSFHGMKWLLGKK